MGRRHEQRGDAGKQQQHTGEGHGVTRVVIQHRAVDPAEAHRLEQHGDHDHHVDDAHVHAIAARRNLGHGNHVGNTQHAGPANAEADHRQEQHELVGDVREQAQSQRHQRQGKGVHQLGLVLAGQVHQHEGRQEGDDVVEAVDQPGPGHCLFIQVRSLFRRGGFQPAEGRVGDAVRHELPVDEHGVPLEHVDRTQLPQGLRHHQDGFVDFLDGSHQTVGFGANFGQFLGGGFDFRGGQHRDQHRGDRAERTDVEGAIHPDRHAFIGHGREVALEEVQRHVGQRDAQPCKEALHQEAGGMLLIGQLVGDERAIRLHGGVVAGVQQPQQQHGHPQLGDVRIQEQADAAADRADQEERAPAAHAGNPGPVTDGANERLDDQAGHRAGQVQQWQLVGVGIQHAEHRVDGSLLQPEAVLNAEEPEVHQQYLPKCHHHAMIYLHGSDFL